MAAPCWFGANLVLADPGIGDPRFPVSVDSKVGGKLVRLVLTGSALRKKYGFSVYTIASYVQEGTRVKDASGLARADWPSNWS